MKLLLTTQVAAETEPRLPADMQVVHVDEAGELDGDGRDAEVFFRWWSPGYSIDKVLPAIPHVRWVHTPSAGVDHILTPTLRQRDILVTNGTGVHDIPVAEFALACMLAHARRLHRLYSAQQQHDWLGDVPGLGLRELYDTTLLILGLGGIGQAIATRAAAFGMRVWASRRSPRATPGVERVVDSDSWHALLPEVDYLVLALPLIPDTRQIIDAAVLRALRPTAYLINVARGGLIDDAALVEALRTGQLAGAALDTFASEPLPPESPYWSLDNVFVSPHCAWASPRMRQRSVDLFLDNLARYRAGKPLRNVVDQRSGY